MYEMIEHRPDWCVSRQRFWGTPIIVFYCEGCGKRLEDFKALRNVIEWFKKEGADAWYKHSAEELLPPGTKCSCGQSKWRKENDILDVWFDSGSSNLSVLKGDEWPADVYLEGPDQYRGWFHSSLLVAVGVRNRSPYKASSRTAGRSMNRAVRCPNLSATRLSRTKSAKNGAPIFCASGSPASNTKPT